MKTTKKYAGLVIAASIIIAVACGSGAEKSPNIARPATAESVAASSPSPNPLNNSSAPNAASDEKESDYKGYHYFYKQDGNKTVALFAKRFLPRDDTIVVGAIRDVIRKVYKEETYGEPYVQNTTAGGTAVRAIRVDGSKYGYLVVPIKEDSGEINSLTITQVSLR